MKVLATGAFGNIGPYVVSELLRRGHDVRTLALGSAPEQKRAQRFVSRAQLAWGDVRDPSTVQGPSTGWTW